MNIRKTVLACITSNFGELTVVLLGLLAASLFGIPAAITVIQILAIDLIAELFPLAALGFDPAVKDIMVQKPRNLKNHILNKKGLADVALTGLLMGCLAFINYLLYYKRIGISPTLDTAQTSAYAAATTLTYVTVVLCQFGNILSRRTSGNDKFLSRYLFSNKVLLGAFGLSLTLIMLLIYLPLLQPYFNTAAISIVDWLYALFAAVIFVIVRRMFIHRTASN